MEKLESVMLQIARDAIKEQFSGRKLIDRDQLIREYPRLGEPCAVFVTLNERHQLRGCIGSIEAHRPLIDDIIHNAKAAAFSDSRFLPVSADELDEISIEISLLSKPEYVPYETVEELKRKLRPGIDGVILRKGLYRAVFLPQVWEQLPDFYRFFEHLCKKAGLTSGCLNLHPDVFRFQVKTIEE